jgi:hypothetical protein
LPSVIDGRAGCSVFTYRLRSSHAMLFGRPCFLERTAMSIFLSAPVIDSVPSRLTSTTLALPQRPVPQLFRYSTRHFGGAFF